MPDRHGNPQGSSTQASGEPRGDDASRSKTEVEPPRKEPGAGETAKNVPPGGVNPELGDMDAAADPDDDEKDTNGLPGRAGGGLIGG